MSQKKVKKTIEVRDLVPAKDAKGGGHHRGHAFGLHRQARRNVNGIFLLPQ